jgi:hypothetical protein
VTDVAPLVVQLLEDVAGAQVTAFVPQQIKHHAPLAAQPHAEFPAAAVHRFKAGLGDGWSGWGQA